MSDSLQSRQTGVRIADRCPSCGHDMLFMGSGGWLTCSWLPCKEPGLTRAIDDLRSDRDRLRAENERLQATNTRLNRRCQSAEAAADTKAEDWNKRAPGSQLRNHYYVRAEAAEAALTRLRQRMDTARTISQELEAGGRQDWTGRAAEISSLLTPTDPGEQT